MELFIPVTKSTSITTTVSKILDHFTLDPHLQLTEITKAQPVTVQAEGSACPHAVSIVEIAVRKLEGMFPFFLIYQYNLATQVEKKVKVGGRNEGRARRGKSKSKLRMLKKREERQARRQVHIEERKAYHRKMRAKHASKQEEQEASLLSPEQQIKIDKPNGEKVHDEAVVDTTGSKRKREMEVSDDSDDLFESVSSHSASSSDEDDDEDTKIHLVPSISISLSFSRLVRDGWTPQIRGG
ncbi:hypothetical protein V1509DRAFT_616316 [Lipomyces kononenkoae]